MHINCFASPSDPVQPTSTRTQNELLQLAPFEPLLAPQTRTSLTLQINTFMQKNDHK